MIEYEVVEVDGVTYLVIDTDTESKGDYRFKAVELFSPDEENMGKLIEEYYAVKYPNREGE